MNPPPSPRKHPLRIWSGVEDDLLTEYGAVPFSGVQPRWFRNPDSEPSIFKEFCRPFFNSGVVHTV